MVTVQEQVDQLIAVSEKLQAENAELRHRLAVVRAEALRSGPGPAVPEAIRHLVAPTYDAVLFDKGCNQVIGWGFRILRKLEPAENDLVKLYGSVQYAPWERDDTQFALVIYSLSEEEAILKYGLRGEVVRGPRGGFRQVTYGTTCFNHPLMRPRDF